MGTPEDMLSGMFKYMGIGKSENVLKMVNTLVRGAQINMLRQLRREPDANIKKLTQEGVAKMAYDEGLDPYKILGIKQDATKRDIDKAYRKRASETHPDHGGSNEEFIQVRAAYEAIGQFRGWK